ncbi:MAG TPA: cytochrome b/b6 domain-containing protein [Candidatus Baltobacteraceae bacterium]
MASQDPQIHSPATRITHWFAAASFVLLFATGAAIFDRRPRLRLGLQTFTLPQVPSWLTMTAEPRLIHYVFAAIFILCGVAYLTWGLRSGHFAALTFKRTDWPKLLPMQLYYLRLRKDPSAYGQYNPLQKLAYTVVLFAIAPLLVLSGVALFESRIFEPLSAIFIGGARLWHIVLTVVLCLFVIGHLGMVLSTGFMKNMRKMV